MRAGNACQTDALPLLTHLKKSFFSVLLERVFLRLGSADSDDQLELQLSKFLTPVLLKLSSPADGVRKKVCLFVR
jgi:hypothetical protein